MCTRVMWRGDAVGVLAGRTMDWPSSTVPRLVVMPCGVERDGGVVAGVRIGENGHRWTARHASIVTTIYGMGTADGVNDAGVAAHMLFLKDTDFGALDARPVVHAGLWASTCSTWREP